VAIRVRPDEWNSSSIEDIGLSCITHDSNSISLTTDRTSSIDFQFDNIFDERASQEDIYSYTRDLIESVVSGYNATIFAFGMTGSGKTHTITGEKR